VTPAEACRHFPAARGARSCAPLRSGHIHESWLADRRWVVQRCNTAVFADLEAVMENMTLVCSVVSPELAPIAADDGSLLWRDGAGGCWRVIPFVGGTVAATRADAFEVARGLGDWHAKAASIDPSRLRVTLPGFHDPPRRLDVLRSTAAGRGCPELDRIEALARWAVRLPGEARVAHFDAKVENFLLDEGTRRVRALVDLDTVMPGSWLWDVGDLARSATGTAAEDSADGMGFDARVWEELLGGYLSAAGRYLTDEERTWLDDAPLVATLEQAVRFLTDHLAGDVYYRVERPGHNLDRCRAQLALLDSMIAERSRR